jgi:hypothetical protein
VKYRKKSRLLEATQWFKNGDHPQDESVPLTASDEDSELSEGKVVQNYPETDISPENRFCPDCGNLMQRHGQLAGTNVDAIVCPGDYIVTNGDGFFFRTRKGEFESQYELYAPPPRQPRLGNTLSDLEKLKLQRKTERA